MSCHHLASVLHTADMTWALKNSTFNNGREQTCSLNYSHLVPASCQEPLEFLVLFEFWQNTWISHFFEICWVLAGAKIQMCKRIPFFWGEIQILWIFRQPSILNLSSWLDKQQKSRITTQLCQFSTFPLRWFLCCANPKRHSWWLYNSNLSLNKMFFVRRRDWKSVEISFEVYRLEMIFEHCLPEEHRCEGLLKLQ